MITRVARRSDPTIGRPTFSVILPVFNGTDTLERAIQSVRAQTDSDWELLAVDDGSADGSVDLLAAAARTDERIRVFSIPNSGGPARPRNRAMAEARGRAYCFLDQDDWWLPEKLAAQRPLLERPGAGVVYADAWVHDEGSQRLYSELWGMPREGYATRALIEGNFIPALTAVVPAAVARAVGPLDERLIGVDDYHWWLRIAMAGHRVEPVRRPLAVYNVTGRNLSCDHDLYIRSLDGCLRDLRQRYPQWREPLDARREQHRLHAFDYYSNRLALAGATHWAAGRAAWSAAIRARSLPEVKRVAVSAVPPRFRR